MDNGGNTAREEDAAPGAPATSETAFTPASAVTPSHEEAPSEEPVLEAAAHEEPSEAEPEPVTSAAAGFSPEIMAAPIDVGRNGDLAAEHKPSEPWLAHEEHHEPADYFAPSVVAEPLPEHSAEQEIHAESLPPAQRFLPTPGEDYWNHEASMNEEPVIAGESNSLFADSAPPPALKQYFERIPTLPPPNREALSDIPFLMPPSPSAPADSFAPGGAASSETVDEVVRRVLRNCSRRFRNCYRRVSNRWLRICCRANCTRKRSRALPPRMRFRFPSIFVPCVNFRYHHDRTVLPARDVLASVDGLLPRPLYWLIPFSCLCRSV